MGKLGISSTLSAVILFFACTAPPVPAGEAKKPAAKALSRPKPEPVRALVVTGGHPFEQEPFFEVFRSQGIEPREAVHAADPAKEANREFSAAQAESYDAIVLYDLWQDITEDAKRDLVALLNAGKGLVVLHHAMADYQKWPEFRKIAGGRFCLTPLNEDGVDHPQSTATGIRYSAPTG